MIPIRDQNPTSSVPVITIVLIAINIALFLTEPVLSSGRSAEEQNLAQARYFVCHAAVPYEVTHGRRVGDAFRAGVRFDTRLDDAFAELEAESCPRKSTWLSILYSMFLHGSILHIAGNMLFLWIFGNNVEDRLGKIRFVLFYLLCGLAAAFAQSYVFPGSATPLIGASGAIAGVLGAYLLMFPRAKIVTIVIFFFITWVVVPAYLMIGVWFLMQLLSSVGSVSGQTGIAYMAHVGGFLAGMLLLLIFRPRKPPVAALPY